MKTKLLAIPLALFLLSSCQQFEKRQPAATKEKEDGLSLYHVFYDPICKYGFSKEVSDRQAKAIASEMAVRDHRIWHYFWHSTRNSWHELTEEQKNFFLAFDPRWKPERLLGEPAGIQILNHDLFDPRKNDAGEDFLFMHHRMVQEVFRNLTDHGLPCIEPWESLPSKDDPMWPLTGKKEPPKDDESYRKMEAWRANFTNPTYLASRSLGEIGYNLEISLHNNMHMRWTTDNPPKGFENRPEITPETLKGPLQKFDDPRYNWLADPYSAHVNKTFWKLHGLVETVLFHWLVSHQYRSIAEDCANQSSCYQWKGTWVGAAPSHSDKAMPPHGHNHSDEPVGAAKGMEPSFEDSFQKAFDQFVNGGSPNISKEPGGPVTAPAPISQKEKQRRRAVILDALRKLNAKAPMNRGALNEQLIDETSNSVYDDPEEYVRLIERKERSKLPAK